MRFRGSSWCGAAAGGEFVEASFKLGRLKAKKEGKAKEPDGTLIRFEPDPKIFKEVEFLPEHIERRLRHYSYLNAGLRLVFNGKTFSRRTACWT